MSRATLIAALAMVASSCTVGGGGQAADSFAPPTTAAAESPVAIQSTPAPPPPTTTTTTTPPPTATLERRAVWLFPGPAHFAGDVLTAQLPTGAFELGELDSATLFVDGQAADHEGKLVSDPLLGASVVYVDAIDTTELTGTHTVEIVATIDGELLSATQDFTVSPDSDRPLQEVDSMWATSSTDCCAVHYVTGSAAERDLEALRSVLERTSALVEARFGVPVEGLDLVLLDLLWGNGGYAGGEVVISYLDRDFGPRTNDTVALTFIHELTHAVSSQLDGPRTPWPFDEAMAVFVTGGHYGPDPLGARAGALDDLGLLQPLDDFFDGFRDMQHEARYVQAGALATYIVETFGWEAWLAVYGAETTERTWSQWADETVQLHLDVDLETLDADFRLWVDGHEPGIQVDHLTATIDLQEARRQYQATYAPYPNYFVYESVLEIPQRASTVREARSPELVAMEAFIAETQRLLLEGDIEEAIVRIDEIEQIVATGELTGPLVTPFLELALDLDVVGLELISLDPTTGRGFATPRHPELVQLAATVIGNRLVGWERIEVTTN